MMISNSTKKALEIVLFGRWMSGKELRETGHCVQHICRMDDKLKIFAKKRQQTYYIRFLDDEDFITQKELDNIFAFIKSCPQHRFIVEKADWIWEYFAKKGVVGFENICVGNILSTGISLEHFVSLPKPSEHEEIEF